MVIEEIIDERLVRHYSDSNYKIQKDGTSEIYDEAVDLISKGYTYSETKIRMDEDNSSSEEEDTLIEEILDLIEK